MASERLRRAAPTLLFGLSALALAVPARGEESDDDDSEADARAPLVSLPVPPVSVSKDGMIGIPAATFAMGSSDASSPPNERPPQLVTVKTFLIDRTEVTVGAYRACVTEGRCAAPKRSSATCTYERGDAELPVNCVTFSDADGFCRARSKRLPTEAEWELAARGPSLHAFPWGAAKPSCALAVTLLRDTTSKSCGGDGPTRVGTRPAGASPFGVLDMSGNVEEWVSDYYAEHRGGLAPRSGASRVLRGGGWLSWPSASRTTTRGYGSALEAGPNVGFRCARDAR